jgi:hypothetical protein
VLPGIRYSANAAPWQNDLTSTKHIFLIAGSMILRDKSSLFTSDILLLI